MGGKGSREIHHHTVEKIVEKIVEKVINVSKDTFEKDQQLLESILNNGYPKIANSNTKSAMTAGPLVLEVDHLEHFLRNRFCSFRECHRCHSGDDPCTFRPTQHGSH